MFDLGLRLGTTICFLCPQQQKTDFTSFYKSTIMHAHLFALENEHHFQVSLLPELFHVYQIAYIVRTFPLNLVRITPTFQLFWRIYFMEYLSSLQILSLILITTV